MAIDAEVFIHESDRAALQALKTILGFSQILKAFMGIWSEKQFKLINMSSNVRLHEV